MAPDKLRFHNIPLDKLIKAVKDSNLDVGAKTIESTGMEFIIRGRGFIGADKDTSQAVEDIEKTVVLSREGVPVRIRDLGHVQLGPDFRRGAIDLNGAEAVGGLWTKPLSKRILCPLDWPLTATPTGPTTWIA